MKMKRSGLIDIEKLITEVQQRQAIWDVKDPHHQNRSYVLALWEEVAAELDVKINVAKVKWKGLRDNFRVHYKKLKGKPKVGESEEKNWMWYNHLRFLIDSWEDSQTENGEDSGQSTDMPEASTSGTLTSMPIPSNKRSQQENIMFELEKKKVQLLEDHISKQKTDDLQQFLGSLHNPMSQLSLQKQLLLRIRIQELIYQSLYETDE